jgi:hypothetical protein
MSELASRARRSAYWAAGVLLTVAVISPTTPHALADTAGLSSGRTKIFGAAANKQVRKGLKRAKPAARQTPEKDAKAGNKRSSAATARPSISARVKSRKPRSGRAALPGQRRILMTSSPSPRSKLSSPETQPCAPFYA